MDEVRVKVVFVGNLYGNTGPVNVNKAYYRYLNDRVTFISQTSKTLLLLHLVAGVLKSSVIIVSGLGFSSLLATHIGRFLRKPVAYLMHGCYECECEINRLVPERGLVALEKTILEKVTQIVCVSEPFAQWVGQRYPQYSGKIVFVSNGSEWDEEKFQKAASGPRNHLKVVTMGGGQPRKNNIVISQAVELLNRLYGQEFQLLVLGADGPDTEKMRQNPHTIVVGQVSGDEAKEYLRRCGIFVQNSILEPFGLGVMEALAEGCSVLVSRNVGALSLIAGARDCDVIDDCTSEDELAEKILHLSRHPNNRRLLSSIDREATSMRLAADRLYEIAVELSLRNT